MEPLPENHNAVLEFVKNFIEENGYSPSVRDIVAGTWVSSTSVAAYVLDNLEDKGLIKRAKKIARGIAVV